jgi:hypothetical protein
MQQPWDFKCVASKGGKVSCDFIKQVRESPLRTSASPVSSSYGRLRKIKKHIAN